MSWAEQFNPDNKLANSISNSMANIKLDTDVSAAEMQAILDSRKMGGVDPACTPTGEAQFAPKLQEQPQADSFQPQMQAVPYSQGYVPYETSAPVINQAASSQAQYSYQPYAPIPTEQQVQTPSYQAYSPMQYQPLPNAGQYSSYNAANGYAQMQGIQQTDNAQYTENPNMTEPITQ